MPSTKSARAILRIREGGNTRLLRSSLAFRSGRKHVAWFRPRYAKCPCHVSVGDGPCTRTELSAAHQPTRRSPARTGSGGVVARNCLCQPCSRSEEHTSELQSLRH